MAVSATTGIATGFITTPALFLALVIGAFAFACFITWHAGRDA